jgi:hypothetical protein
MIFVNVGCKQYSPKYTSTTFETGSNVCHGAASRGDLGLIQQIAEENEDMIYAKDGNWWQPLHEVRSHQCCPVYFVILNSVFELLTSYLHFLRTYFTRRL